MRIENVHFKNFRLLRDATLPLEPLTLLVGANGSGKTSALDALRYAAQHRADLLAENRTLGVDPQPPDGDVSVRVTGHGTYGMVSRVCTSGTATPQPPSENQNALDQKALAESVESFRMFDLSAELLASPSMLRPGMSMQPNGSELPGALDQLRDRDPEGWRELNDVLPAWLPEFDQVLFETPVQGQRAVVLRTRRGGYRVPARQLSAGTRLVLGLLAISHGAVDGSFFGIEEPEAGIHPRLLRNVYDALVRMTYSGPSSDGRDPQQVIVTTHSPYLVDLFRDHPESVVVAERHYDRRIDEATVTRLSDHRDIDEIVSAGPLGEAWYTGVLGGVPVLPGPGRVAPAANAGA